MRSRDHPRVCGEHDAGSWVNEDAKLHNGQNIVVVNTTPNYGTAIWRDYKGDTWSKYEVETEGVLVAYASIHGGTKAVAEYVAEQLRKKNAGEVAIIDLCRCDMAKAIEYAFRYSSCIFAASSYDSSLFPPMYEFIHKLQLKNWQNRRAAIIENGSWAPPAGRRGAVGEKKME